MIFSAISENTPPDELTVLVLSSYDAAANADGLCREGDVLSSGQDFSHFPQFMHRSISISGYKKPSSEVFAEMQFVGHN